MLATPEMETTDLSTVRWIATGAAPVPVSLLREYEERNIAIYQADDGQFIAAVRYQSPFESELSDSHVEAVASADEVEAAEVLEIEAGAWLFEDDDRFVAGRKEQEPIFTSEIHLIRRFSPGFWMSLDWTYYNGGRQTVGGNELSDTQSNSRLGGTLVKPLSRRHAIKLGYATGLNTRFGTDFDQFLLSFQILLN